MRFTFSVELSRSPNTKKLTKHLEEATQIFLDGMANMRADAVRHGLPIPLFSDDKPGEKETAKNAQATDAHNEYIGKLGLTTPTPIGNLASGFNEAMGDTPVSIADDGYIAPRPPTHIEVKDGDEVDKAVQKRRREAGLKAAETRRINQSKREAAAKKEARKLERAKKKAVAQQTALV